MTTTRLARARPRRALVTACIAAALAAIPLAGGEAASARTLHITPKAQAFHDAMRALWQEHGTFTERAIVAAVAGLPETQLVVKHLLHNQVEIGNAVKPYYGEAGGRQLTELLKAHINAAVATVLAAKSGDAARTKKAEAAFFRNGRQIAGFLHAANPTFWSLPAMRKMMRVHLDQVVGLAVDQIKGNYRAATHLYGRYIHHLLFDMADMLSSGIVKQFPAKFR